MHGAAPPEGVPGLFANSSFPNVGVSLRFLRRIRDDPRLRRPVCSLPFVSTSGTFGPAGTLISPLDAARVESLDLGQLRALAQEYRVFSELEGGDEFGRYAGTISQSREQWMAAL